MKNLLLCFAFLLFAGQSFGQTFNTKRENLTPAEERAAGKLAGDFTRRLYETNDISSTFKDFFIADFMQRYIKEQKIRLLNGEGFNGIFIPWDIKYNSILLDKAPTKEWENFYALTFNFLHYGASETLNKTAGQMLQGKEFDERILNEMYPPEAFEVFESNPLTKNKIIKKGEQKSIQTLEDLRSAALTFEKAMKLLNTKPVKLNSDSESLIEKLKSSGFYDKFAEIKDGEYFGFPKGTRFIIMRTPSFYRIWIVKDSDNKYKIIWANIDPT